MISPNPETASSSILVVDDDQLSRMILTRRLELEGFRVTSAENGRDALEKLYAQEFDLIMLDVVMPEMDGNATLRKLKNDEKLRDIPVIMISALDDMDSVIEYLGLGAHDYLPKPFDSILLLGRVNGVIFRKRLQDLQDEYKKNIHTLIDAVSAIENRDFDPRSIDYLVQGQDPIGELAKALQQLAKTTT